MIRFTTLTLSGLVLSGWLLAATPEVSAQGPIGTMAYTKWVGSETLEGFGRLEFRFGTGEDMPVLMIDTAGKTKGQYDYANGRDANGRDITVIVMTFGSCVYTGAINGQTLSGTARDGGKTWRFSVRLTRN